MRNPTSRPVLVTLALLAALPALTLPATALSAATPIAAETYQIDPAHSNIGFRVRHLMSKVTGRFGKVSGTVNLDPKDVSRS
jgi:polyisoprenoid-binding protein YceI